MSFEVSSTRSANSQELYRVSICRSVNSNERMEPLLHFTNLQFSTLELETNTTTPSCWQGFKETVAQGWQRFKSIFCCCCASSEADPEVDSQIDPEAINQDAHNIAYRAFNDARSAAFVVYQAGCPNDPDLDRLAYEAAHEIVLAAVSSVYKDGYSSSAHEAIASVADAAVTAAKFSNPI